MAGKKFNFMQILVVVNENEVLNITGYIQKIRSGFSEIVEFDGLVGAYPYGNRPWEATRFEIALKALGKQLGGEREVAIQKWLDNKIKAERAETHTFCQQFENAWGKLTDRQKKVFEGVEIETQEQADTLLRMVQLGAVMNELR